MITGFERILISVPDLAKASTEMGQLTGDFELSAEAATLKLANVSIELRQQAGIDAAQISGLVMGDDSLAAGTGAVAVEQTDRRGLSLELEPPSERNRAVQTATALTAVDHLVLQTNNADACISLFGEQGLGLRLALDQHRPDFGGRMVFFRCGKMTLEIIQSDTAPPAADHFWGITYISSRLEDTLTAFDTLGVDHSAIRTGRKPGTRVATVKSHSLNIPTLLIEHPSVD